MDEDLDVDLQIGLEELETLINADSGTTNKGLRTKLVQDLVTRWNSTLAMLISVSESHSAIRMVITTDHVTKKKFQSELLNDNE